MQAEATANEDDCGDAHGTPLVEVASVVGVSRSTLYRRPDPGIKGAGQ